ncbi:MAG: hypothetical protein U1F83_14315 [Verrucomicrobiota bacterium]
MNLRSFIERAKLDFSDLYFTASDGTGLYSDYAIKPTDFITFAKADFYTPDTRGLVNALSNAKRAIDCQADSFLQSIGIDPDAIDKQLGRDGMTSIAFGKTSKEGPLKFRLLEALGIATPSIVGRMRTLRNLLEHEYRKPSRRNVSDAIGIAELFVQACSGKMKSMYDGIGLGSGVTKAKPENHVTKEFYIRFEPKPQSHFEVVYWNRELPNSGECHELKVQIGSSDFVPLLKLNCLADWDKDMTEPVRNFLTELGFKLPLSRFRVRDGHEII